VIEQVCNIVACRLLLPEAQVRSILGNRWAGWRRSGHARGSLGGVREVCVIALAERMPCDGFVAVVNLRSSTVTFAARAGAGRPYPRRDEEVPTGHPLLRLADDESAAVESWWPWPDRNPRHYYQQATRRGHWIYAVLADNDLWNAAHVPHPGRRPARRFPSPNDVSPVRVGSSEQLGASHVRHARRSPAPVAAECDCDRKERLQRAFCDGCFISFPVAQLEDGLCSGCRR